jgi:hypothetical protein
VLGHAEFHDHVVERAPCIPCTGHAPLPFSKALLGAAAEDASITEQQFLTLAFRSPLAERAYGRWMAHHHLKVWHWLAVKFGWLHVE